MHIWNYKHAEYWLSQLIYSNISISKPHAWVPISLAIYRLLTIASKLHRRPVPVTCAVLPWKDKCWTTVRCHGLNTSYKYFVLKIVFTHNILIVTGLHTRLGSVCCHIQTGAATFTESITHTLHGGSEICTTQALLEAPGASKPSRQTFPINQTPLPTWLYIQY